MKKILLVTLLLMFALSIADTGSVLAFPGPLALLPPPGTIQLVKNCLNKLVTSGTITPDQADKVSNYLKQNKFNPKNSDSQKMVSDLKNMGLTDKQAQATTDALCLSKSTGMSSDMEQSVENGLNKLVTSGTITQDQADKVSNYLKQNKFNPKNSDSQKMVSDLKNMGLTDKQAQATTDALCLSKSTGMSSDMEQSVENGLNKLVTSGTITQDQADKISNYLKQNKFDPKNADSQKMVSDLKNMGLTDKQAQATTDSLCLINPQGRASDMEQPVKNSLNKLVTSGKITQDQADKVSNYLKQNKFDPKNFDPQKMVSDLKNMGITDKQAQAITDVMRPSAGVA